MSYRCGICKAVVPAETQMLRITKYRTVRGVESERTRTEIESETPACPVCYAAHNKDTLAEKFNVG